VASDDSSYVTGTEQKVDGGVSAAYVVRVTLSFTSPSLLSHHSFALPSPPPPPFLPCTLRMLTSPRSFLLVADSPGRARSSSSRWNEPLICVERKRSRGVINWPGFGCEVIRLMIRMILGFSGSA